MDGELKFGYLPSHVLQSINDLGNWKVCAAAGRQQSSAVVVCALH